MCSETIKLPIIDFSNVKQGINPEWDSLKTQVLQALQEYGCFEALFDKIPQNLRKSTVTALQQLFELPVRTKIQNRSGIPYHGYVQHPLVPLYESLGIEEALTPGKIESFTNLMWPEGGNPFFSENIYSFMEQLSELDQIVRRMVVESLGLEKYMDEHMGSTNYLIRAQKYSGPQTQETKLGLTSHTDKNIATILYQNEVKGLEILTKDGKNWFIANPSPNSFIVMIGEAFSAWTNGRLHSAHHQVMMTGDEARYSIGLFSVPKKGYMIKAPEEMVDEEHPLLFNPFDHVEFLNFYYSEAGQKSPAALKAYCGV